MLNVILQWVVCYASAFALGFFTASTLAYVYIRLTYS
jgi:hypothetical protein